MEKKKTNAKKRSKDKTSSGDCKNAAVSRKSSNAPSERLWNKMLEAWREKPLEKHIADEVGVTLPVAKKAILKGWPEESLPPFKDLIGTIPAVHVQMHDMRKNYEEASIMQTESARMAAEQALAARITMDSALKATKLSQKFAAVALRAIERGEVELPEILTADVLRNVVTALKVSAETVEKAMKIEHLRTGKPELVLGIQVGMLLDTLEIGDLEFVAKHGVLPGKANLAHSQIIEAQSREIPTVDEIECEMQLREKGHEIPITQIDPNKNVIVKEATSEERAEIVEPTLPDFDKIVSDRHKLDELAAGVLESSYYDAEGIDRDLAAVDDNEYTLKLQR